MYDFLKVVQATCGLINFGYTKDRYKTNDELMVFGAIDFGNASFNHVAQIQGTFNCLFIFFYSDWDVQ